MANHRSFDIVSFINCNTKNVIYLAECVACQIQYVGCTSNSLKTRIRRHISDSRKTTFGTSGISNLSRHFAITHKGDTKDLRVCGIERVRSHPRGGNMRDRLLLREANWIFNLESRVPHGLNLCSDILFQLR